MGRPAKVATGLLAFIAIFIGMVFFFGGEPSADVGSTTTTTSTTTTVASTTTTTTGRSTTPPTTRPPGPFCKTWLIRQSDNSGNRWFADGVKEIRDAETSEDAQKAAHTWLARVKQDPELLSGAASYILDRQVDSSTLEEKGCGSAEAEALVAEIELTLAEAEITPDEAPEEGYNSGVHEGAVVGASNAGIGGDRESILIELPDGTKIWVMARCGNPVVTKPPPVPPGPTDENPSTTTTTSPTTTTGPSATTTTQPVCYTCGSTSSTTLKPKDPTQDPIVNPAVPPIVKGPGSTPVGHDPGPASPPTDSPTGCNGPCPTTTTRPSAGSGTSDDGTGLPSGGDSGVDDPEPALVTTSTLPPATGDPGGF